MSKITDKDLAMFIAEANGHIFTMDDDSYVDYCATLAPELAMEVRELRQSVVLSQKWIQALGKTVTELQDRIEVLQIETDEANWRAMGDDL